jgi:acetyl esterase/lipase
MTERTNKNWLVKIFFVDAILLIIYIIVLFSPFGLILWEIAFIFAFINIFGIVWAIRRIIGVKKGRIVKYRHYFVIFTLIVLIGFNIFAIIPFFYVNPLGTQFEASFKEELGENYYENIPEKYRNRLKAPGSFFGLKGLGYFVNPSVSVEQDLPYGSSEYEKYDKYEDTSIIEPNKPALVFIHGGGSVAASSENSFYCRFVCNYFASLGFVAFSVEFTPTNVETFPRAVKDVRTALADIKVNAGNYNIDSAKIVIMGGSFGGHMATLSAYTGFQEDSWWRTNGGDFTKEELEVACVVDLYGTVNPIIPWELNHFLTRTTVIKFNGSPYDSPEKLDLYNRHLSKNYISADLPPTLIIHGVVDGMVSIEESRDLQRALKDVGASHIYLEVPFGQHAFDVVPGTPGNQLTFYFVPRFVLSVLYG